MEASGRKRFKRSSNFTKQEEMLLVQEVEKFKNVIECKITDKVNNRDKNEAWVKITAQFNAKGPSQQARSLEQLKSKYDNLKTRAKKTVADNRRYLRGTGGGPSEPDWDPVVEAILKIINKKTVIGCYNGYDSDAVYDVEEIKIENHEVVNQCEYKEDVIQKKIVPVEVEDFDGISSSSEPIIISNMKVGAMSNENDDIQTYSESEWGKYSNSLHIVKQAYYEKRNSLLGEEIKLKKIQQEDHQRKIQREEEEHEIKMKILKCELKLKENKLNNINKS